jgi:hypothetical protein
MLKRDRSTEDNRKFWDHVEKCAAIVKTWPAWMRGAPDSELPEVYGGEPKRKRPVKSKEPRPKEESRGE